MMLTVGLLTAGLSTFTSEGAQAQEVIQNQSPEKKPIDENSLPQGIKDRLQKDYKDWTVHSAFLVSANPAYYEVTITSNEGEQKVLSLNELGKSTVN